MRFPTFNIPFIPYMRFLLLLSAIAIGGSLYLIAGGGLNFGIDFKGGLKLQYQFAGEGVTEGLLRDLIGPLDVGDFMVQQVGEAAENRFMIKVEENEEPEAVSKKILESFRSKLQGVTINLEEEATVGPKAGKDLRRKGQMAIIVSWILMLVYIGYRFNFAFAPGAIIALIHDVLVTLAAFAFSGREVSLSVIAALLTITGYSVNDTIVIYDRIRENLAKLEKKSLRDLVNISLNETLSRTIITSLTVLFVVAMIYLFGEGEFQNFGFAMTVGVISGTISTLFIACPVYIFLREHVFRNSA